MFLHWLIWVTFDQPVSLAHCHNASYEFTLQAAPLFCPISYILLSLNNVSPGVSSLGRTELPSNEITRQMNQAQ